MATNSADQDEIVSHFCAMTDTRPPEAHQFLDANDWDLEAAVTDFFAEQDEALQDANTGGDRRLGSDDSIEQPSGASTLESGPAVPSSATLGQPPHNRKPQKPQKKFATLGDLSAGNAAGDSSDEHDEPQDFFAGGEKSGLAVQNPDSIKQKIIEKAKRTKLPSDESKSKKSYFTGTARTLGGDDTPSHVIPDANEGRPEQPPQRIRKTLHFWSDGFSVDDGDLYRADDPQNAEILQKIRKGRAPLSIMNIQPEQEVDIQIQQHDGPKPKPKYKPFSGRGQRLGSPTPALSRTPQPDVAPPAAVTEPDVDESQPTVILQIRLGDGTRLTSRFNTSHTIGDVYSFVAAASPASRARQWVLMTTFPSKELNDKTAVLGDLSDFKRGGVVVQRWQ